jgi:phosphatidylserine decarboxylase
MARHPAAPTPATAGHLVALARRAVPLIHPAGRPFILAGLTLAAVGLRHGWARRLGLGWAVASAAFFRHPSRVTPVGAGLVVAPADGEVCLLDDACPPAELGWTDEPRPRISIFLSLFDVHVQRSPVAGVVTHAAHCPGQFLPADDPAASSVNERQGLVLETPEAFSLAVVQVAGLVARRIVCDVAVGDTLAAGQTYGLIRFGSRVDLYLPRGAQIDARLGQRAIGGETVLARLP